VRKFLSIFRGMGVTQPPYEHKAGSNFDYRINPETNQRDAARESASDDSDKGFERCPADA
jgi:hypothetical protein